MIGPIRKTDDFKPKWTCPRCPRPLFKPPPGVGCVKSLMKDENRLEMLMDLMSMNNSTEFVIGDYLCKPGPAAASIEVEGLKTQSHATF